MSARSLNLSDKMAYVSYLPFIEEVVLDGQFTRKDLIKILNLFPDHTEDPCPVQEE